VSKLLIDEPPLIILPGLAVLIGLNEAIFCQQLHYLIQKRGEKHEEVLWVHHTYDEWRDYFPFWSVETIKRVIRGLQDSEHVIARTFNEAKIDRTKWYRLDYSKFDRQVESHDHEVKMTRSSGQSDSSHRVNLTPAITTEVLDNNKNIYIPSPDGGNYTFDQFMHDLPRKRNRAKAKQAWDELNPDVELQAKIRNGMARAKNSTDWENKQWIPSPETLIRDRFWENDYIARGTNAILKAGPDPVPTSAEPEKEKREYSDEEKAQNSRKLREALKGVDLNANRTQPA
jgi:hypothetical protein